MTQSGTVSAKNRGVYSVTFSLKDTDTYCWEDNSTESFSIQWTIGITLLPKPVLNAAYSGTFTYNGFTKSIQIDNYDSSKMSMTGYLSATDAGDYSVTFKLLNTTETLWEDQTSADVTIDWKIKRKSLSKALSTFAQANIPDYDGTNKTFEISGFNSTYHTISGDTGGMLAKNYQTIISVKSNFCWSDGTYGDKVVTCKINPRYVTIPVGTASNVFTWDGELHGPSFSPQITQDNSQYLSLWTGDGCTTSESDVGDYRAGFVLVDKGYPTYPRSIFWEDGTYEVKFVNWKIDYVYVEDPYIPMINYSGDGGYWADMSHIDKDHVWYNEGSTGAIITTADEEYVRIEGNYRYWRFPITFKLKDTEHYRWYTAGAIGNEDVNTVWSIRQYLGSSNSSNSLNAAPTVKSLQKENTELRAAVLDLQRAVLDLYSINSVYNEN